MGVHIPSIFFSMEVGIKELISSYNLHLHGDVERNNQSIIGVIEVMIHEQGLLMFLW